MRLFVADLLAYPIDPEQDLKELPILVSIKAMLSSDH
jgi:hypothetical protein